MEEIAQQRAEPRWDSACEEGQERIQEEACAGRKRAPVLAPDMSPMSRTLIAGRNRGLAREAVGADYGVPWVSSCAGTEWSAG